MKDAKSTTTFVQALNESLEAGALMCQLYNGELNKYVMKLTTEFCRNQMQLGIPKVHYLKTAAECPGRQPGSKVWVLNEDVQLDECGSRILPIDSEYIWLGTMTGNRNLASVAPASDAASIPLFTSPQSTLDETLTCLRQAVANNYTPAFFLIASAGMAVHYELIIETYGMCPMPVAVRRKNTGKSTAARTALALLGTPQFFVREFSTAQTFVLNSRKTFPTVYDEGR